MVNAETLGLDRERIMVMGHSSGGAIATDLCLIDRDEGKLDIKGQILDYAPLDQELDQSHRTIANPDGSVSESRALQYIHWFFANETDVDNPLASPARCADVHGLPRMLVIEAEEDSLHEEEMSYAERCREAGVDVMEHLFKGCGHGFTHECFVSYRPIQAREAWDLMASFIRETVNR
jgi:acetyl esterase